MWSDKKREVCAVAADNPSMPLETLHLLAKGEHRETDKAVAGNPVASSKSPRRLAGGHNPNAPSETLWHLARDKGSRVRKQVKLQRIKLQTSALAEKCYPTARTACHICCLVPFHVKSCRWA